MSSQVFIVNQEQEHRRLDQILVEHFKEHSRSYYQYLFENKAIKVNKKVVKKQYKPKKDDIVCITHIPLPEIKVKAEDIPLDILFEDDDIIVINKDANMCTHPAVGNTSNTVAGALSFYVKELKAFNDNLRPGIVHRLDKQTSGVLIAAKTIKAHQALSAAFKNRAVRKTYLALCHSAPSATEANFPIFRDTKHRQRMAVNYEKGRQSHTTFEILEKNEKFSLVQAHPTTGRTHQIRVHLKALQSPIVGDKLYTKKIIAQRQMLHAHKLELNHPLSNQSLCFKAPVPADFIENYKKLIQVEKNSSILSQNLLF